MSANPSSDLRVNTYVSGRQANPDIAIGSLGNFVITWQSDGQDGDDFGIFARVYNNSVVPLSSEFRVNTTTLRDQTDPAAAMDTNGNFIITWVSDSQSGGSGLDVYAQRFSTSGVPIGSEFRINRSIERDQSQPDVAMDANGNFVVVYASEFQNNDTNGRDDDGTGIFGQRFDRSGALLGPEFRVNTLTQDDQFNPVVAMNANGDFVVVWTSERQDGNGDGIFGQRYSNTGLPLGAEFQVNTSTTGNQRNPSVAIDNSGDFVVTWQGDSFDKDSDGYGIYARRYNSLGNPGHEFLVNKTTGGNQITPAVAIDANGNFTIVWASENSSNDEDYGIFGQRFRRDGRKTGGEFLVNRDTNNNQTQPVIAVTPTSDYVVAWQSQSQSGDQDIRATGTTAKREIRGNQRDNTLKGSNRGDRILGLRGNDLLRGFGGNDVLEGGQGDDRLEGGNEDDILLGGVNRDRLDGGNGNDNLTGGQGEDTFVLRIKQGTTLITDFQDGIDKLGLSAGLEPADVRVEQRGDNTVVIWQGTELATLFGIAANTITVPADFVEAAFSGEEIRGTSGPDTLTGTDGSDEIFGLRGNDRLFGRAGDDVAKGGAGNDRLFGEADNDTLHGGGGDDRIDGSDGNDYLAAGNGNDIMIGGIGSDIFLLELKRGRTTIRDFQNGTDFLRLAPGLNANAVQAQQQGLDTLLSINGQRLALLKNVIASQIGSSSSDFV